jgi:hypothetical protein
VLYRFRLRLRDPQQTPLVVQVAHARLTISDARIPITSDIIAATAPASP